MCGIAGLFHRQGQPIDTGLLQRMTAALAHRGPEATAVWVNGGCRSSVLGSEFSVPNQPTTDNRQPTTAFIGLGHTRLRIIDVEGGDQPIWNEDGSCLIVFNGEIYNFRELRSELETRG